VAGTIWTVPISSRLLDDDEEVLVDQRPHWAFLFGPAVLTAVAVAVAVTVVVRFQSAPVAVAWVLVAMVAIPGLWLAGRVIRWLGIRLVVTSNRLIYRRGVVGRNLVQLRLQRIAEVHYTQTLLDRLIGSGRLVVELVGESPMAVHDVRRPRYLQRVISDELDELTHHDTAAAFPQPGPAYPGMSHAGLTSVVPSISAAPPATDVPSQPVVVPRPFTLDRTPPHGVPVVHRDPMPTLPTAPPIASQFGSADADPTLDPRLHRSPQQDAARMGPAQSVPEQLIQLDELRRRGIISDAEFEAKKTELLSRL